MSELQHIVCPLCNAVNRVAAGRLGDSPNCGKCHNSLFTAHPPELTRTGFQQHITRNDVPVVVDFWAPWCAPCKIMAPAFEQASAQLEPQFRLVKLNTENEQAIATQFRIRSIPTLALFKNGLEVARQSGAWARQILFDGSGPMPMAKRRSSINLFGKALLGMIMTTEIACMKFSGRTINMLIEQMTSHQAAA